MPRIIPLPDDPGAPAAATPDAPVQAPAPSATPLRIIPTDENGQPITPWRTQPWAQNIAAGAALGARTGIRVLSGIPNLAAALAQSGPGLLSASADQVSAETGGNYSGDEQKKAMPVVKPMVIPSEAIIHGISGATGKPLEMAPDAGMPMRVADFGAPFFLAGAPGAVSRIGEAAGGVNKVAEGLGYLTGAGTDAGLSYLGGQLGQRYGGDAGGFAGSMFGGAFRPVVQRGFGWGAQKVVADPNAGQIFDAMTNPAGPNTMPAFGQVSGPSGKQFEKSVGSVPIIRSGVNAARTNAEEGIQQSVATGVGEVGNREPNRAPVDPASTAGRIIDLSRIMNQSEGDRVSAQQQQLAAAIGSHTDVDVSPVAQTMTKLAQSPTTGPANTRALNPRIADLNELIQRQNPVAPDGTMPYPPTAAYGGVKDLRSDLGARSNSVDPLQGYYLKQSRDALTDVMRNTAEQAGQGPAFDKANLDYATFKQTNQPWLEKQGGSLDSGAAPANPTTIASRANAIPGSGSGYLTDIASQLGLDPARATLADVLSRQGQIKGQFTPSRWGSDYAQTSPVVKQFIAQNAPTATPYLENAATGGRAFDLQPERPGLSNSLGFLGGLGEFLAKAPGLAVGAAGGLETPSVIRALAGRTDIPALLAQYAARQGAALR